MWRHQVAALTRWRCIAPDLRGAGTTGTPMPVEEFSMDSYAGDLIALLDQSQIGQAVFCGLSMGGYITFELLRRFPERVRAAILCNTKADCGYTGSEARSGCPGSPRAEGRRSCGRRCIAAQTAREGNAGTSTGSRG